MEPDNTIRTSRHQYTGEAGSEIQRMQTISKRSAKNDTAEQEDYQAFMHGLRIELDKLQRHLVKNNLRPLGAVWRNTWLGSVARLGATPDAPAAKDNR